MSSEKDELSKLIGGGRTIEPPRVEAVEPEVRTGIQYAVGSPARVKIAEAARATAFNAAAAKNCLIIWGFDVAPGKEQEFHAWLRANEHTLADACPEGIHYLATYIAGARAPRGSGAYRALWSIDSFDAMARFGDAAADRDSEFSRLLAAFHAFQDKSHGAGRSELMLQRAAVAVPY